MNKTQVVLGMLTCGISLLSYAQTQNDSLTIEQLDEVVVTDSKFKLKRENSGKVITKISQADLKNFQGKSVADIINNTVGIEINGVRSNAGQSLSYFVRGGRNRQVLILIDGVPLTDASQIANDYDLRLLNADQVESIEILKGASSTLYGTGAASAVINITLKQASKKTIAVNLKSTLGTNNSKEDSDYDAEHFQNSVSVNGNLDKLSYLASFSHQYTDGLSAISAGEDSDVFNSHNGYLKLGYQFSDKFKLTAYTSFDKFKAEFDDSSTFTDADNLATTDQYRIGVSPEFSYKHGNITLNAAYNAVERDIQSGFPTQFKAKSFVGDLINRNKINDTFFTVLGVNAQHNEMESFSIPFGETELSQSINPNDASFTIVDPYVNVVYVSDFGLNVNAGLRLNNHSAYGSHVVYSLNPSFKQDFSFGYLKGLASYSTAFITPSLFQLFEPSFGNDALEPEENRTIELGLETGIKNKARFSIVYFNRLEERFIDFVDQGNFVFQYANINDDFTASGFEFVADVNIFESLKLSLNGTYTQVDEDVSLRIPEIKINAALNYQLNKNTFMSLNYQYNDEREDAFFNNNTFMTEAVNLASFSLIDFYISHELISDRMTIFANVNNILNEDYEELFGFSTRGRNFNVGFNLNL